MNVSKTGMKLAVVGVSRLAVVGVITNNSI